MSSYTLPTRPTIFPSNTLKKLPVAFSLPISYLAVVGNETADGQVFHFRLSLVSTDQEQAIRINMQPSYTDMSCPMRGVALVEHITYPFSDNHGNGPNPFRVPVTRDTTSAGTLLGIIFDKHKLDQYIFNDDGNGCRHWCATVLGRLAQEGVVDSGVSSMLTDWENKEHEKLGSKFPMPRITGSFYP